MTKAIRLHEYGGPEVLKWEEIEVGDPNPDEVRIRHKAIGVNYRDIYHRNGVRKTPESDFPLIIGGDGAGVIEAIGSNVVGFEVGQRVVYGNPTTGSYAEVRLVPSRFLLALPDAIEDQTAAAMMVKGLTAHYLLHSAYRIQSGDTILVQAAAGGVGLILCQWAKHLGASVIGTVSTEEKAELARTHGCDKIILYSRENFSERVQEITEGVGVDVVYDGVGKATFEGSLDCLRLRGTLVGYGNASGHFPKFDPLLLMNKGSLSFTRTSLKNFITTREELEMRSEDLFKVVSDHKIKIEINQTYALKDAAEAHRDIEARKTTGSSVLLP